MKDNSPQTKKICYLVISFSAFLIFSPSLKFSTFKFCNGARTSYRTKITTKTKSIKDRLYFEDKKIEVIGQKDHSKCS